MNEDSEVKSRDNSTRPIRFIFFWGIPFAGLLGASFITAMPMLRASIYIIAFAWLGIACLFNALQCNRVHCWFTGPWLVLVAIGLFAYEFLDIRPDGISFPGAANGAIVIAAVLRFAPELIFGKYFVTYRKS